MKNKTTPNNEIIIISQEDKEIETPINKVDGNTTFHSKVEEFFVTEIQKVDLKEAEKELDNRIVVQHKDFGTNIPCFNATAKRVLVRDDNGKHIVINNHDEIKKQQLKNKFSENKSEVSNTPTQTQDNFDDGIEFVN